MLNNRSLIAPSQTNVAGVSCYKFQSFSDPRGTLSFGEFNRQIPFTPQRYFIIYDVQNNSKRGEHAHLQCYQFLMCIKGSCSLKVDDGSNSQILRLDSPEEGFLMPPLVWGEQYAFTDDAVLLVFASHFYDENDYISEYSKFIKITKEKLS